MGSKHRITTYQSGLSAPGCFGIVMTSVALRPNIQTHDIAPGITRIDQAVGHPRVLTTDKQWIDNGERTCAVKC